MKAPGEPKQTLGRIAQRLRHERQSRWFKSYHSPSESFPPNPVKHDTKENSFGLGDAPSWKVGVVFVDTPIYMQKKKVAKVTMTWQILLSYWTEEGTESFGHTIDIVQQPS